MSADEIRRLAESCKDRANYYKNMTPCSDLERDKWYRDAAKIESDKASALLDYAAMVERCEGKITSTERHQKECLDCGLTLQAKVDGLKLKDIIYILRGDAGEEEK